MILLFLIVIFLLAGVVAPRFIKDTVNHNGDVITSMASLRWGIRIACTGIVIICFLMTSCLVVDTDSVGHLKRIYMGSEMPQGRIIAAPNEKGPQARILAPGFHLIPFVRVFFDVEEKPVLEIEQGKYGFLVAKDGNSMPPGQFIAPAWESANDMIDAMKFMGYDTEDGKVRGVKGPQLTVLPPGHYRVNRYLFDVYEGESTPVPAGHVAVIKSNVGEDYKGAPILPSNVDASDLSVPIVPKGYRGVWETVHNPGEYYINRKAYDVTIVDTRVQTWKYLGGYTRKWIDLVVEDNGKITQEPHEEVVKMPEDAADTATVLRVEGWDVFQDSRVQVQVTPENAPFVVASVGGLQQVEDKIITPNYRSILRNVVAEEVTYKVTEKDKDGKEVEVTKKRPRQVLDLLYHREELEKAVARDLIPTSAKAGVTVQWVRFGDPAVPPSLLLPGKRKQLADSLISTYRQEKIAQTERVQTEKERARADQQATLMKSEIGIQVADNQKSARIKVGEGEKQFLTLVAQGQEKQANVLGKEKAFELAYIEKVLDAAVKNPGIIKVPTTLVAGSGSSLEGAAAILGANNLTMGLKQGSK
jgi:hypothetical protein